MKTLLQAYAAKLEHKENQRIWLEQNQLYLGDIHNHCAISYGHGSLSKAIAFAQQQLDFFSVTGHFAWPDMENPDRAIPPKVIAYHKEGFARLRKGWDEYLAKMQEASKGIVTFVSYEYHSFELGDYTILVKDLDGKLPIDPEGVDTRLTDLLRNNKAKDSDIICMPHHIGYKTGFRGINWDGFNEDASPIIEIMSMHGASESEHATPAYLHTMGPKSKDNTMQGGLTRGLHFGVVGSTDHHNASPGSYGSGRAGVWALAKTQDAIWDGILQRQTIAYTGDRIAIASFVNDSPMGSVCEAAHDKVELDAYVLAPSSLKRVEILLDGEIIDRVFPEKRKTTSKRFDLNLGWGQRDSVSSWKLKLSVEGATITDAVPRFRGEYVVDPLSIPKDGSALVPQCSLEHGVVAVTCITSGNVSATTDGTQGFGFGIEASSPYKLTFEVELIVDGTTFNRTFTYSSVQLQGGSTVEYLNGFVSPAFCLSREMDESECMVEIHKSLLVKAKSNLYVRAFEDKGDAAWTSAIWVNQKK